MGARTPNLKILWVQKLYWQTDLPLGEIAEHVDLSLRTVQRICAGKLTPLDDPDPEVERAATIRAALRAVGQRCLPFGLTLRGGPLERYLSIRVQKERAG